MAALANPRHERFAQELAKGKTADAAYVDAGYKTNRHNAAALGREKHISTRVAEIQERGAVRAEVTVASLLDELEQARVAALTAETVQSSAAVSASMSKAKLLGMIVDKTDAKVTLSHEDALAALR